MHIFEEQMCTFEYLALDIILSLVCFQKLDWTHTSQVGSRNFFPYETMNNTRP